MTGRLADWAGERGSVHAGLYCVELTPPTLPLAHRLPVVLLPKVGGWTADWRHVAELLAAERRVVVIDLPGHGRSSMTVPAPYAQPPERSAHTVLAALAELDIDRRHLVGTSLGGIVAAMAAIADPVPTASLSLVSVSLAAPLDLDQLRASDSAVRHNFDDHWLPLPRGLDGADRFGLDDPRIAAEQDASRAAAGAWVRSSERGAGLLGLRDHLHRITAPTLVLGGTRGMYVKYTATARELIPAVTVTTIPDSGAFVLQECPSLTADALRRFFGRSESTGSASRQAGPHSQAGNPRSGAAR
jgi:pimeloyl-ACP methyl ester carboxylesterase